MFRTNQAEWNSLMHSRQKNRAGTAPTCHVTRALIAALHYENNRKSHKSNFRARLPHKDRNHVGPEREGGGELRNHHFNANKRKLDAGWSCWNVSEVEIFIDNNDNINAKEKKVNACMSKISTPNCFTLTFLYPTSRHLKVSFFKSDNSCPLTWENRKIAPAT